MDVIRFHVRHPDGRVEELLTESPRVLIGAASHCEIRLPIGSARAEHVLIQSTPAGWRAVARSFDPAPRLNGVEFTEAPVIGESVIAIDRTRIDVAPSTAPGDGEGASHARGKGNPRIYLYLVLGAACWVALYSARVRPKTSSPEPADVPALWASTVTARCPQTLPEPATAIANARMDLAVAKQERSPFHPEDGVAAVPLFESAEACFRVSGHQSDANEAATSAASLRRDMVERFRAHRLRLQRALATEEWVSAERESAVLLAFLQASPGEYVVWLSNLRRRLQFRYGAEGKKK